MGRKGTDGNLTCDLGFGRSCQRELQRERGRGADRLRSLPPLFGFDVAASALKSRVAVGPREPISAPVGRPMGRANVYMQRTESYLYALLDVKDREPD